MMENSWNATSRSLNNICRPPLQSWFRHEDLNTFYSSKVKRMHAGKNSFCTPLFPDLDGDNEVEYFFNNHVGGISTEKPICSAGGNYSRCGTFVFGRVNSSDRVQPMDVDLFLTDKGPYGNYDNHGGAVIDLDGDGYRDLYMNAGGGKGFGVGMGYASVLFWGSESSDNIEWTISGGSETALDAGLENLGGNGRGRSVYCADFNMDGLVDVLLINDLRKDGLLTPSQILYNEGNRTFQPDPSFAEYVKIAIYANSLGAVHVPMKDLILQRSECHGEDEVHKIFCKNHVYSTWAVYRFNKDLQAMEFIKETIYDDLLQVIHLQAGDFNGDGMMDFFLASRIKIKLFYSSDIDAEIISAEGPSEEIYPPSNNYRFGHAVVNDFDLDGSLDILAVYEDIYKNTFVLAMYSRDPNASAPPFWTLVDTVEDFPSGHAEPFQRVNDIASVDYNNDGLVDVVFSAQTFPHLFHLTNTFTSTNCAHPEYLAIVLQGSSNVNAYGIGSSLKLIAYDTKMMIFREFFKSVNAYSHGTTKHGGATDHRIVFGLGYDSKPTSLSIVWPDGRKTYVTRRTLRKAIYNMTNPLVVKHSDLPSQNKCADADESLKFKTSKSKNLTCSRIYNLSENEKDDICGQVVSDKKRKNRVGIYIHCPVTCGACYNLRRF